MKLTEDVQSCLIFKLGNYLLHWLKAGHSNTEPLHGVPIASSPTEMGEVHQRPRLSRGFRLLGTSAAPGHLSQSQASLSSLQEMPTAEGLLVLSP